MIVLQAGAQNVGFGTTLPKRNLHIHSGGGLFTALQLSNNESGQEVNNYITSVHIKTIRLCKASGNEYKYFYEKLKQVFCHHPLFRFRLHLVYRCFIFNPAYRPNVFE